MANPSEAPPGEPLQQAIGQANSSLPAPAAS